MLLGETLSFPWSAHLYNSFNKYTKFKGKLTLEFLGRILGNDLQFSRRRTFLIDFGYLKKGQDTCPDHSKVVIVDGQAVSQ